MTKNREPLVQYLIRPTRGRLAAVAREYHEFVWSCAYRITSEPGTQTVPDLRY